MAIRHLLLTAAVLRLTLIIYGDWQDSHMAVRYTDIDYTVFSDAASLILTHQSPYARSTFRYSPILPILLLPNHLLHPSFGKLFFSLSDLLVGVFVDLVLNMRGVDGSGRWWAVMVWLFNPFTCTIGTRGNCEPVVCAVVVWVLICIMKGKVIQAAFWYGLIVHFRIYPIIYALPFVLVLGKQSMGPSGKPVLEQWSSSEKQSSSSKSNSNQIPTTERAKSSVCAFIRRNITKDMIVFGLVSGSMFFFWTGLFFYIYGWDFLNEALLYHLTRTDPRHNFSIYFYHIYLLHQHGFSVLEKLISFLPQLMVQLAFISRFADDLPFCLFLQTVAFVAFNKVVTAQYFVWFFCLLPLILPWTTMKLKWNGLICITVWMGSQLHWLWWGYLLEFKGQNVFVQLWLASLLFLAANTFVMVMVIRYHRYSSTFRSLATPDSKGVSKSD